MAASCQAAAAFVVDVGRSRFQVGLCLVISNITHMIDPLKVKTILVSPLEACCFRDDTVMRNVVISQKLIV